MYEATLTDNFHYHSQTAVGKPKWHRSFTNATECKYEFVHKWISSGAFKFEKTKQQTIPKNRSRYTKKTWCVKCNKTITALHFVQYHVLWSTENNNVSFENNCRVNFKI
jgi:hypothetical protein